MPAGLEVAGGHPRYIYRRPRGAGIQYRNLDTWPPDRTRSRANLEGATRIMINGYLFTLVLIFGSMYWIYAMGRKGVCRRDQHYNEADTQVIQELHRGLERMGQRIEALETILLDQGEHYRRTPPPVPEHDRVRR